MKHPHGINTLKSSSCLSTNNTASYPNRQRNQHEVTPITKTPAGGLKNEVTRPATDSMPIISAIT